MADAILTYVTRTRRSSWRSVMTAVGEEHFVARMRSLVEKIRAAEAVKGGARGGGTRAAGGGDQGVCVCVAKRCCYMRTKTIAIDYSVFSHYGPSI
jgi:hypothetical protein